MRFQSMCDTKRVCKLRGGGGVALKSSEMDKAFQGYLLFKMGGAIFGCGRDNLKAGYCC